MPIHHHDVVDEARKLLAPYAEDGAMYLDQVRRGWYRSIDESMNMADQNWRGSGNGGDVLSQISHLNTPNNLLFVMSEAMVRDSQHERLGFQIPNRVYDELLPLIQKFNTITAPVDHIERIDPFALAYEILTELWQEEVADRV
jgi:hypothetical protein